MGARRAGFSPLLALWSARVEARPERRSGQRRPSRCGSFGSGGPTGTRSWDPSRAAIAEVLITSHGFALLLLTARRGEAMRAYSKPWLVIRTSAIAALDGSHELVPVGPPELKDPQRYGLLCPERRSGRASTRADQSARSGPKPALLAHTAHTTSKKTTERCHTTILKVPRGCF